MAESVRHGCRDGEEPALLHWRSPACCLEALALGSWLLLCGLDIVAASRAQPSAARSTRWWSHGLCLFVLAAAALALLSEHCTRMRSAPGKPKVPLLSGAMGVKPSKLDEQTSEAACLDADGCLAEAQRCRAGTFHGTLVAGGSSWLVLQAIMHREPQIWIGASTLYALASFAAMHCALLHASADGLAGCSTAGECRSPTESSGSSPCSHSAVLTDTGSSWSLRFPFSRLRKRRTAQQQGRWKPLFKDPTFSSTVPQNRFEGRASRASSMCSLQSIFPMTDDLAPAELGPDEQDGDGRHESPGVSAATGCSNSLCELLSDMSQAGAGPQTRSASEQCGSAPRKGDTVPDDEDDAETSSSSALTDISQLTNELIQEISGPGDEQHPEGTETPTPELLDLSHESEVGPKPPSSGV